MADSRKEGGYQWSKKHLNDINIRFTDSNKEAGGRVGYEEVLMEELQPHSNLMTLQVSGYNGVRIPDWMTFLPNFVRITVQGVAASVMPGKPAASENIAILYKICFLIRPRGFIVKLHKFHIFTIIISVSIFELSCNYTATLLHCTTAFAE